MKKPFGSWLRDYSGENTQLQGLSVKWKNRVRNDYVPANAFRSPEEVWTSLQIAQGKNAKLERLVHLAYEVHQGRMTTTKTRFRMQCPNYRPDSDVPSWPPIWE